MDTQDQEKTTPSGHENQGVHLCPKCGWPFPKSHPSAKHRRAHKRICGTIEGYKLTDSDEHTHFTVSDDEQEHPSDEDRRTPSPKFEKRSIIGSGEVGERSNRSEDEFFSDTVAEFLDSGFSPGIEEGTEGVKIVDKDVARTVEGDMGGIQSLKFDAIADSTEPLSSSPENSEVGNPDVPESAIAINIPLQDTRTEEVSVAASSMKDSSCDFSLIKSDTPADAPRENLDANFGDNVMQNLTMHLRRETDVKGNKDEVDELLGDGAEPPSKTVSKTSETESELQEIDGKSSHSVPEDGFIESMQSQIDGFEREMSVDDVSPQSEPVEHKESSFNTVQIKADPAQDIYAGTHGDFVEICDTNRDVEEAMHVLSVANDIPVVDHADIMIEDFKDHRTLKSNFPLILGSADVIRPLEDDNKGMVFDGSPFSLHSSKPGGIYSSSADMNDTEDNLKQDGEESKLTIEVPDEEAADTSKFKVTSGEVLESNGLEAPPSSSRSEKEKIQANCYLQGVQLHSAASHMVSSVDEEVSHTTKLSEGDRNNHHEMVQVEEFVTGENESSEGFIEKEFSANANTNFVSKEWHQTINLTGGDDRGEHRKAATELSDIAWSENSTEAATAGEHCATNTITKLEPGRQFSDSTYLACIPDATMADPDTSDSRNMTMTPTHPSSKTCPDKDSQKVRIEPEINSDNEVVTECVGADAIGSKLSHNDDVEVSEENSEKPIVIEPGPLPVHSEFSRGSSPSVEDSHRRDGGKSPFGVISEPMQNGNDKLTKQPCGASAVDISVDSSCQTDSVEGNWGSVSEPQQPGKSENANLHPKIASERQHYDKADVFEPPSFMTLVERGGGVDQKDAGSEIETVQSSQQPSSEALQAAWFPSLTNVVNESQGRKKNEEIIAKVTNWSIGEQHTPLKNLLGEAKVETKPKSPIPKQTEAIVQNDEAVGKSNGTSATTVKEVLGSEAPANEAVKRETAKEWNSPARYPVEIKKEKRKVKGKPSWVPFVCCSSVN